MNINTDTHIVISYDNLYMHLNDLDFQAAQLLTIKLASQEERDVSLSH